MEERSSTPCPQCRHGNPLENRFCGACGAPLTDRRQLARRPEGGPPAAGRALLPAELKPVGRALAVGLATLAARAGLAWLRRRAEGPDRSPLTAAKGTEPVIPEHLVYRSFEEVHAWVREGDLEGRMFARRAVESFRAMNPTDGQR
ncbi:MAG: zinc ribbon domain-containing protein [Actinomycetota bacterium]|nr:zinc ribbon domain-containing protein [Actinomycetota bacterium]